MKKNLQEMEVKAINKSAILESHDGEEFSLITVAKNVLCEDGTTMQDYFDNHSEPNISTKIVNSNSMSKVGQGDSVDFSDNVMNGAYEDVVLKGKSLVNVIQGSSKDKVVLPYSFEEGETVTINDTHSNGRVEVEVKGKTLVNLAKVRSVDAYNKCLDRNIPIKPNTKYIGIFKATYYQETGGNYACFMTSTVSVGDDPSYNGDHIYSISCPDGLGTEHKLNKGDQQFTFTSKSNEQYLHIRTGGSKGFTYEDMIVLEYQEGMENWDIPYFEGMASVQAPTVKTCGKNLFYGEVINNKDIHGSTGLVVGGNRTIPVNFIPVKPKTTYTLTRPISSGNVGIRYYSKNQNYLSTTSFVPANGITTFTFTTPIGCYFLKFIDESNTLDNNYQIEEGSTATTYERYQSSSLTLPEEIVLRGLPNGTCDTYNTKTKEYVQRIGEYVITGDEPFTIADAGSGLYRLQISNPTFLPNIKCGSTICDKLKGLQGNDRYLHGNSDGKTHYIGYTSDKWLRLVIDETITTVQQGKDWLSGNLVTFQYELAEPIITKVDLPSLKAYDTVIHLSSIVGEGSLVPMLASDDVISYPVVIKPNTKYSIVAHKDCNYHTTNLNYTFDLGGVTTTCSVNDTITTVTTPTTLSHQELRVKGQGLALSSVRVIEGEVTQDLPYFEGICDCKSPILSNVGKNLVNVDNYVNYPNENLPIIKDGEHSYIIENKKVGNWQNRVVDKVKLKANTTYTLSYDYELLSASVPMNHGVVINLRDDSDTSINISGDASAGKPRTFTPTRDTLARLCMYATDTSGGMNRIKFSNIQLEESSNRTEYEPYKSNTTTFDQKDGKTIVLRSLPNGVCDTLNVETGEYVQRIGHIPLSSTLQYWEQHGNSNDEYFVGIVWRTIPDSKSATAVICNKLKSKQTTREDSCIYFSAKYPLITFHKDSLDTFDMQGFNAKIDSMNLEIQYELETPIVKQVNVEGYPYAYENGHVLLKSGSQEQSLTPTIEYSIVANRGGQIRSNQRMVERHQKKLDSLYAMTLVNMIDSQYKQVLMKLKSELGSEVRTWDIE